MAKIIGRDDTFEGVSSFKIDFGGGMVLWFDTWVEYEGYTGDWNKYIFYTNSWKDREEQAFQEASSDEAGAYNFETALDLCLETLKNEDRKL